MEFRAQAHLEALRLAQKGSEDQGKEETRSQESEKRANPVKEVIIVTVIPASRFAAGIHISNHIAKGSLEKEFFCLFAPGWK